MASIVGHLVTSSVNLSPLEVLHAPPDALLGVSAEARASLEALGIHTVFDLASSRLFANAATLTEAGTDPRTVLARYGLAPADMVDALPAGISIDQLRFQGIEILEGIGPANAADISAALVVTTVRDLALWPPYRAAREILEAVFFPDAVPGADPEAPADLLPKSGEYPTERVFYTTLVFDGDGADPAELAALEQAGPVELGPVAGPNFGFERPGIGALLTMAQSWYAQGVALGQLLHSVALAPGESTRIAMLDWSRRTSGRQAEDVTETEALSNVTEHSRALSEVTSAVAQEAQSGFSEAHAASVSTQQGGGSGFSLGPITLGGSSGRAVSRSDAMSFSSSSGRRDLSAAMTQNVVDRTQQHANAARNRRATVVREVSQEEHETVSTRVVTNYNHMHALSIQYYEVVQVYRVAVQLARVEKCLFVPMRLIDFKNAALVRMFRKVLVAAAVDPEAKALLETDFDTVLVKLTPGAAQKLPLKNPFGMPAEVRDDGKTLALPDEAKLTEIIVFRSRGGINDLPQLSAITMQLRDGTTAEIERAASSLPTRDDMKVITRPPLREIASIAMTSPATANADHGYLCNFVGTYKGMTFSLEPSLVVPPGPPVTVLTFTGGGIWERLVAHLEAHRLHYSQAIFEALDPATVTLLLSKFTYGGRPVAGLVDPQPVTTAGNYLVFKTHVTADPDGQDAQEREWAQWLDEHGVSFAQIKEDLVPLPSGGVFAEAVPGRYNAAEKLDLTRFWNWQDSPIPIQAPEIAPVQLGSRAQPEDLKAGAFSQPLVNIVSPTSLPDPMGMSAVLQAISNGNMFRDMSGLAATIGLAQAGLQTTSDAATAAGVQAGSNLATAAKKEVEMFKAALAFAGAILGGGSTDTSPSTISNEGAKINHGRSLDTRGGAAGAGAGGSGGAAPSLPAGGGGAGARGTPPAAGTGGASGGGAGAGRSQESLAFDRALWGGTGAAQGEVLRTLAAPTPEMAPFLPPPPWEPRPERRARVPSRFLSRNGPPPMPPGSRPRRCSWPSATVPSSPTSIPGSAR